MSPQNVKTEQPSAIVLPESDIRFDQELVEWFALRGGIWSGTAGELLAAVKTRVEVCSDFWPHSSRALYAHIESHMQILRSLGVEVCLRHGNPRMISLRGCQDEKTARRPPSAAPGFNRITPPLPINLPPLPDDQKTSDVHCGDLHLVATETVSRDIPKVTSESRNAFANGECAGLGNFEGRIFENPGEALVAIVEIQGRIREQGLDLQSAIDLVVGRTWEITRCSGLSVGMLKQGRVVYPARVGIAVTGTGPHFSANLFQSCLAKGETLQLLDAQNDPAVGDSCRREGIRSLIIVPIFHGREVAGAMEFIFQEMHSFSTADVMDLELIAGIISEYLSPQVERSSNQKAGLLGARGTFDATLLSRPAILESRRPNPNSHLASGRGISFLWPSLKSVWIRSTRPK
jgi:hypothetical protein